MQGGEKRDTNRCICVSTGRRDVRSGALFSPDTAGRVSVCVLSTAYNLVKASLGALISLSPYLQNHVKQRSSKIGRYVHRTMQL